MNPAILILLGVLSQHKLPNNRHPLPVVPYFMPYYPPRIVRPYIPPPQKSAKQRQRYEKRRNFYRQKNQEKVR